MNSDQYAEKIKDTRADIDHTLHTLEDKLSPRELWDQALKWSDGAREFSLNFGRTVRENPVPAALMGLSLLWLMTASTGRRFENANVSGIKNKLQGKYGEAKSTIRDTTAEAGDRIGAYTKDLKHQGEQLMEQGQEWGGQLMEQGQQLKNRMLNSGSELSARPVLLSAMGLAVGALIAMSLPVSRKEEEVLGEPGRRMYRKASEVVGEQMERGKEAVASAADAVKEKYMGEDTNAAGGKEWTASTNKPDDIRESTH